MLDPKTYGLYVSVPAEAIDALTRVVKAPPGANPEYVLNKATILVGAAVVEINRKFAAMNALIASDTSAAALWAELDCHAEPDPGELTRLFGRALALATKNAAEAEREREAAWYHKARFAQVEARVMDLEAVATRLAEQLALDRQGQAAAARAAHARIRELEQAAEFRDHTIAMLRKGSA